MNILRARVLTALEAAHLSTPRLARLLGARETYVQRVVADLRSVGVVRLSLIAPCGNGRPHKFWRLTA